jgi:hypothetical protein
LNWILKFIRNLWFIINWCINLCMCIKNRKRRINKISFIKCKCLKHTSQADINNFPIIICLIHWNCHKLTFSALAGNKKQKENIHITIQSLIFQLNLLYLMLPVHFKDYPHCFSWLWTFYFSTSSHSSYRKTNEHSSVSLLYKKISFHTLHT